MEPRCALVLCLLATLGAAEEVAEPDLELVATPGLIEAALAVPPLSLLRDPAAAAAVAHIAGQLAAIDGDLMRPEGLPELFPVLRACDGLVFHVDRPASGQARQALAIEVGSAAEGVSAWMDDLVAAAGGQASRWEGFSGFSVDGEYFLGHAGTRCILGNVDLLPAVTGRLARLAAGPADPHLGMTWRLGPALTTLERPDQAGMAPILDELLGAWRGGMPTARIRVAPAADGWHGTIVVGDLWRLPLDPLDAEVAGAARAGWPIIIGLHLEPRVAYDFATRLIVPAPPVADAVDPFPGGDPLPQPPAPGQDPWATPAAPDAPPPPAPPPPILRQLTGDCLLQARWDAGPLPTGAVLLRLHDGDEAAPALAEFAAALGAVAEERADAEQAFRLATGWGPLTIARHGDRLVVGDADGLISAWLAGVAGDAPLAAGRIAQVDVDLPAIARQWLPLAWVALAGMEVPLGQDPLEQAEYVQYQLATGLMDAVPPASVGAVLAAEDTMIDRERLGRLFPGPDLAATLDASCAVYVPDPLPEVAGDEAHPPLGLVLRFADGFTLVDGNERRTGLDAADLAAALPGWKRLLGPDPSALPMLPSPAAPAFDRRWLPPLAVALRHVPAYHLDVGVTDFVLRADERGVPALALAVMAAAVGFVADW